MTWKDEIDEDALSIADTEMSETRSVSEHDQNTFECFDIEELDNDEINANEAGFLKGYLDEESGD